MSESNGACKVIRVDRKGLRTFAFGEGAEFTIDVIVTYNRYLDMRRLFADADGNVPVERHAELARSTWDFVRQIACDASGNPQYFGSKPAEELTMAEALEFITHLTREVIELQHFFEVSTPRKQSSPESMELRFST